MTRVLKVLKEIESGKIDFATVVPRHAALHKVRQMREVMEALLADPSVETGPETAELGEPFMPRETCIALLTLGLLGLRSHPLFGGGSNQDPLTVAGDIVADLVAVLERETGQVW